jgi:hypothetical protein
MPIKALFMANSPARILHGNDGSLSQAASNLLPGVAP